MWPEGLAAGSHVGSQGESSSGRSNGHAKTPRQEHAWRVQRAGQRVSEENETGLGGLERGRDQYKDLAGMSPNKINNKLQRA